MQESGAKSLKSDHLLITLVAPKPRKTLDTKKISTTNPKLFDKLMAEYGNESTVKPYVKITPRSMGRE